MQPTGSSAIFSRLRIKQHPEPDIININSNFFGGDTGTDGNFAGQQSDSEGARCVDVPGVARPGITTHLSRTKSRKLKSRSTRGWLPTVRWKHWFGLIAQYREQSKPITKFIGAVLCQKLVRRLCDNCKLGFEPPPQLLKQLGIPAGRVGMLYQPFIPPPIEQQVDENGRPAPITPCHVCGGRGYYGRIGIFELLTPGDQLKASLLKTQDQGQLSQIAKAEGHRGIQAEAVLTVARGLTSLDELKRVFAKK